MQYEVGAIYNDGKENVPRNYEKAAEWWSKAAKQGHEDAQWRLGFLYYFGDGVPKNYERAVEWWLKAAEQGSTAAQIYLGDAYENGKGVPQSYEKAIEWYRRAGDAYSRQRIAEIWKLLE